MVNESFIGAQAAPAASGYARSIDAVFGKKDMTGFLIVTALTRQRSAATMACLSVSWFLKCLTFG
jgi:hypothetical protein